MEGPTPHRDQTLPPQEVEAEVAEEVEAEVEAEVVEEVEAELVKEELFNWLTKEISANKEPCRKSSKEIDPKQKNSSKTYEATFIWMPEYNP